MRWSELQEHGEEGEVKLRGSARHVDDRDTQQRYADAVTEDVRDILV